MSRGILLAGNESTLFSSVAAETEKKNEHYLTAVIPALNTKDSAEKGTEVFGNKGIPLAWNPGSPVSCRSMIIAAENRIEKITDALLVCSPPPMYRRIGDVLPFDIETFINKEIKGWYLLVRELSLVFRKNGGGTLALIVPESLPPGGKESAADLLGAPAASAFRTFANGLPSAAEPFSILGFTTDINQDADFAAWIYKIIYENNKKNSGKWHKFGKFTLFK